jgi:hypothetical protein
MAKLVGAFKGKMINDIESIAPMMLPLIAISVAIALSSWALLCNSLSFGQAITSILIGVFTVTLMD